MSNTPTPQPSSGYASPAPSTVPSNPNTPKSKATNVFSNDGSFLERFQRNKKDEEDKKKQEEALTRKREFDSRFKKRGKRPPPDPSPAVTVPENPPSKKARSDKPLTEYEKEVKSYTPSLKDSGIGVRPLVK
ncbi:hypothetical protein SERLA73DRAFT_145092 [Serpula lacrymans var. lacrymans S7.3]|uniref:Uncharacterized protein n=2 Tax=Serpula lacrymans var. lacrymans TaxID=341189 RepID=F8QD07_SERL3|nr:uncharacterized protein SERLADRAFT_402893 [Serpula lacrymans var. lacrymans S7.9]EGN94022.1 hypothetical protein SERLA73DRAFT_145092 [Serpula lacrymans var. lacrymans S7.3]EGO19376.1 hypothetical protein SERLADRAFT_402893 [Serpula lacrymans var. lacrymans S7.9]